jgi:peptidoglycan/LPS O-acetylase OafA/YrhL
MQKLEFAHALRGIAALLVAFSHLFGFWFSPAFSIAYLHSAPLSADTGAPWLASMYADLVSGAAVAQFAIALFFLISGFVIPFGLPGRTPLRFLAGRFFRIWPLYAVGLAITVAAIAGVSSLFGATYFPSFLDIVSHLTFTQDIAGVKLIDGIVWTLNIEVRFYLLCALIAPWLVAGRAGSIVMLAAAGAVVAVYLAVNMPHSAFALGLASTWMFMSLMFVGTIWNFVHRGKIKVGDGFLLSAVLLVAFAVPCRYMPVTTTGGHFIFPGSQFLPYYLASAGAFLACFLVRSRFPKIRVLRHLGDISYPLYVIHAMLGGAVMRALVEFTSRLDVIMIATLLIVWAVSYALHVTVEIPTHRFGRSLANRGRDPDALSSALVP